METNRLKNFKEQLKQYDIQIELLEKAYPLNKENDETIRYLI